MSKKATNSERIVKGAKEREKARREEVHSCREKWKVEAYARMEMCSAAFLVIMSLCEFSSRVERGVCEVPAYVTWRWLMTGWSRASRGRCGRKKPVILIFTRDATPPPPATSFKCHRWARRWRAIYLSPARYTSWHCSRSSSSSSTKWKVGRMLVITASRIGLERYLIALHPFDVSLRSCFDTHVGLQKNVDRPADQGCRIGY